MIMRFTGEVRRSQLREGFVAVFLGAPGGDDSPADFARGYVEYRYPAEAIFERIENLMELDPEKYGPLQRGQIAQDIDALQTMGVHVPQEVCAKAQKLGVRIPERRSGGPSFDM